MIFKLTDHQTIGNQFIGELRDVKIQQDRMRFRRNLERVGEVMAYEISRTLDYQEKEVETPLGIATIQVPTEKIVLGTILRAGLPLHQGLLNVFDQADNAFISAYRKHHKDGSFEIKMEYVSCPDLTGTILILADPMLATGASMSIAIEGLAQYGKPKQIHVVTAIASDNGVKHIRRLFPKVKIWAGAVDEELTAKSYIVPGLGDAGDLCYGEKMQD